MNTRFFRARSRSVTIFLLLLLQGLLLWSGCRQASGDPGEEADGPDPDEIIYDDSEVPDYTLPPLLSAENGDPVETPKDWWNQRRPELASLFETNVYGQPPPEPPAFRIETTSITEDALDGAATRKQVTVHFTETDDGPRMDLLVYVPNDRSGAVPVFEGLNFAGNHSVESDPAIDMPDGWVPDWSDAPAEKGNPLEESRGARSRRWPAKKIVNGGYALVTAYYGDLFPDRPEGLPDSVYQLDDRELSTPMGNWSAISAWAWGTRRLEDFVEGAGALDGDRSVLVGHSRLGKTVLWASALDRRFDAVISNASGAGGAALFRRRYGERVEQLCTNFPHWFHRNLCMNYREREDDLPVDQHQLLALTAPRPLLINAMTEDEWADPKGMFLAARHASPAWSLLEAEGLNTTSMPGPDEEVLSRLGYAYRSGAHDVTRADWSTFLNFANRHLHE